MTYTFKLARRLAVSRNYNMLPVLLLFAACSGGDATAPEGSPPNPSTAGAQAQGSSRNLIPVALSINPSNVTLETNQLVHFRAQGRTSAGDSVGAAVTWSTTGGTILPDGRFSAAVVGTYKVVGRNRVRDEVQVDTSTVLVVRRQPKLASVVVTPSSASLTPGVSRTFTAVGHQPGGTPVAIGVNWSAAGGSIDGGGTYVAGDTAGTYQVIATNTAGTLADTATITISGPPSPPPPPPAPALAQLILVPASVTLAPSAARQFQAYGRTIAGDSVAVSVVFAANGGSVTPQGLYTAGPGAGTFRVIASAGALADTSTVTVKSPLGSGTPTGIPFGPYKLYTGPTSTQTVGVASFTASIDYTDSGLILARIAAARAAGKKLILMMTDNGHAPYITNGMFDLVKWKAAMDVYKTAEIKAAVAAGVADGTVIGESVLDEPNHKSWGGVLNKAVLDQMCGYVKGIFPTLPTGVVVVHWWRPAERYNVCDFIVDQYDWWQSPNGPGGNDSGNILGWRDAALAMAAENHIAIAFSLNILDGGIQDLSALRTWTCPLNTTGGQGTYSNACRMTAAQVRDWGSLLGPAGCAMLMWRYDATFMSKPDNLQAMDAVAALLATRPAKSCTRM